MCHRKKYEILTDRTKFGSTKSIPITGINGEKARYIKRRWLVNLSKRPLSQQESSLLERGLNYAVTPETLPVTDFITTIEEACEKVGAQTEEAAHLRSECVNIFKQARPPRFNIPAAGRRAQPPQLPTSRHRVHPRDGNEQHHCHAGRPRHQIGGHTAI